MTTSDVRIYHDSPKEFSAIEIVVNGTVVPVDDLELCIILDSDAPEVEDDRWAAPDTIDEAYGVMVGAEVSAERTFEAGDSTRIWYKMTTEDQTVIDVADGAVIFY